MQDAFLTMSVSEYSASRNIPAKELYKHIKAGKIHAGRTNPRGKWRLDVRQADEFFQRMMLPKPVRREYPRQKGKFDFMAEIERQRRLRDEREALECSA